VKELRALYAVVERDLKDAKIPELSAGRRFATAYNAVLQLATMAVAASGYRVVGLGHHQTTLRAFPAAMGAQASPYAVHFEMCRRKRNQVDYDTTNAATETQTADLLKKAEEFRVLVKAWIEKNYPQFRF
jgi:hypothetical protein